MLEVVIAALIVVVIVGCVIAGAFNQRRFGLRAMFLSLAAACLLLALFTASYRSRYPYGRTHRCDKQLGLALLNYAQASGGKFPSGGATPEASLSLLYPTYLSPSVLCGKTLPEDEAAKLLEAGRPLTPQTCDWWYIDGLSIPRGGALNKIAIVWDKVGLGHNGERLPRGGHSVVFMDGHSTVIDEKDWPRFLASQQEAWTAIREGRSPPDTWLPEMEW